MKTSEKQGASGIDDVLEKFPRRQRDDLIPILQATQHKLGFISEEAVYAISDYLNLPASKVYGVTTFFNQFRLYPPGKYSIKVCAGTACHVSGAGKLLQTVESELGIKAGQTSKDGLFSVETVYCMGACSIAPVVEVNGEFFGKVSQKEMVGIINKYRPKENKSK